MINAVIITLSALLQLAAAGLTIRLIRVTGRSLAWILLALASVGMALRRLFVLLQLLEHRLPDAVLPNEVLGLAISVLMLVGMVLVRRAFLGQAEAKARAEQERAEAHRQSGRLRTLMEATPIPTWIAEDPSCVRIAGNPAAMRLLRMPLDANPSKSAPPGEAPTHFTLQQDGVEIPPADLPMQRAARGEEVRDEPMDLVFADGEVRRVIASASPVRNAAGGVEGAVCAFMDYTEIGRAEQALRRAQKLESLGLMAGGIAHDFNNIFQGMMGHLELATTLLPPGHPGAPHLGSTRAALDRAARLSRDLLHFSGGELHRPVPGDLSALVAGMLGESGAGVARDLADRLPPVHADPGLLRRALENLVANALEASAAGAPPRVSTYARRVTEADLQAGFWPEPVAPGPWVVLEVSDQGAGIPAQDLPRLFDPFFSTRGLGRGLGLPAALGIARGHRGGIQVESTVGAGSTFRIHLPCAEAEATPVPEGGPGEAGTSRALLLADDERELREALAEMLREWFHFEVVEAEDGQEALELFQRQPAAYGLVILDATMPRLGGVEAFDAMRRIRPALQGILCSGFAVEALEAQARAHGFSDFLTKPFTSGDLERVLERSGWL